MYEGIMHHYRKKLSNEEFEKQQFKINVVSSFTAGSIAAAITNPLECITVNKQTTSDFNIRNFVKQEGMVNIITKGMLPRVAYNGLQSILFFSLVMKIGQVFDVKLEDD